MTHIDIQLFGTFQVTLKGSRVTDFATDKARALLAYLVVEAEKVHRRDVLAGLLWPDQPQRKARQNLRQALSYLRRALNDQHEDEPPFLLSTRETLQFNVACDYELDVAVFTSLYEACQQHRHRRLGACRPCLQRLEAMVDLYQGGFLEQFSLADSASFEEWALLKREWFHLHVVEALSVLARYYERLGNLAQARAYIRQQVILEPWREEAHRYLIRLLALDGQRSAALAQYETCCQVLQETLGVDPTNETQMLCQSIRDAAPMTSVAPHHILPVPPTSFVGRKAELTELANDLINPDCRLITLVGPGGVGKTRLALQVAEEHIGTFAHGVYFVPLSTIQEREFIVPLIAETLRLAFLEPKNFEAQLINYLREKEILLVLDNMDHVLEASDLLVSIIQRAPSVMLLVTSRERLNLREEWVYTVEGLTYALEDLTEAAELDAVCLFEQHARQLKRHFALSEQLDSVLHICRLVEGMPLGIELAASWAVERSCLEIAREIEHNLDGLTTALRNVPERHRSIRASFEHSWRLLSPTDGATFAKLAIFRGGFTLDAAREVMGTNAKVLQRLVHKSLLRFGASDRYHIHQLLQQYAAEKLPQDSPEVKSLRRQHAEYYATFLYERASMLKGVDQVLALQEIRAEIENVRAACFWALDVISSGWPTATALRTLQRSLESLYHFYLLSGWYQEGIAILRRVVDVLEAYTVSEPGAQLFLSKVLAYLGKCFETIDPDEAQCLFERSVAIFERLGGRCEVALPMQGLGYIAHVKGHYEQAKQYFQTSLEAYRQAKDTWGEANVLSSLCLVLRRQGQFENALKAGNQSLVLRREISDLRGIASSLHNLGLVHSMQGNYEVAKEMFTDSLERSRQIEHKTGISNAFNGLCQAMYGLGDIKAAERMARESLSLYRDLGDRWGVAISLNNLGYLSMELGDCLRAKHLYQEGLAIYRQMGIKSGMANLLSNLGEACYHLGEYAEAKQNLHTALEIARSIGAMPIALEILIRLAPLFAQAEQTARGLELLMIAMQHPALIKTAKDKADALFDELSDTLSPAKIAQVKAKAQQQTLESVIADLLKS